MTHRSNSLKNALFLTMLLALGCSKSGVQGASDSDSAKDSASASASAKDSAKAASVESRLLGVYKLNRYQASQETCDQLAEVGGTPGHFVLYAFHPSTKPEESRLGGTFCADVGSCRALAGRGPEPSFGYSFIEGADDSGWRGWAIPDSGASDDERCRADVQTHVLSSTAAKTIKIETTTVQVVFDPRLAEGDQEGTARCINRDAINATSAELPCKSYLVLDATWESDL